MSELEQLIKGLTDSDNKKAYQNLISLQVTSSYCNEVYPFFDVFAEMLNSQNSYIRTRAIILIAENAKWDTDFKVDQIIDKLLTHITDTKAITARQCIKVLPKLASYKPDLTQDILNALHKADIQKYNSNMQPLIQKDIQAALCELKRL